MISEVMWTQQSVSSSWRNPQMQDDLWCDVQYSRLWAAAEEVHKFRFISDIMCNTADSEQQLKKSTNSGSLMWCATQQSVSSSWRSPQIQDDIWCDVQHSRLWRADEVQKFRVISDVVCNKDGWEVKCWHLLVPSIITPFSCMNRMSRKIIEDKLFFRISIKIHYSISVLQNYFLWCQQQNYWFWEAINLKSNQSTTSRLSHQLKAGSLRHDTVNCK